MELSEYERKRLENIRRNQEVLRSLNIPKIGIEDEGEGEEGVRKIKTKSVVQSARTKVELPTRRSSRIIEKATGVKAERPALEEVVKKVKKARPPPIVTHTVKFTPQQGATDDFVNLVASMRACSDTTEWTPGHATSQSTKGLRMKHENCILKVARDRIYSVAVHPNPDHLLLATGTKTGELIFWSAQEVLECNDRHMADAWQPQVFSFSPHSDSISNLAFVDGGNRLLTTSYDGSCLAMDLAFGTFTPWFSMSGSSAVVTGFDVSAAQNTIYHSDTAGWFRISDLRMSALSMERQLHEAKIGGVSISRPSDGSLFATASNDRTIGIWDVRNIDKPVGILDGYRNAITAVNFHPRRAGILLSTCYDDHVRVHFDVGKSAKGGTAAVLSHNNQTGRWITLFKAVWDPKSPCNSDSLAYIGNMEERGVDILTVPEDPAKSYWAACATSPWLTAQPAVNAAHPNADLVVSGNASGKLAIWSCN